jgi:uncharacterized protein YcbK (DUF882 family)
MDRVRPCAAATIDIDGCPAERNLINGQAAEIRVPGQQTKTVRWAACRLKMGGVGYYPQRKFLHIDVGPVRYWNWRC